MNSRNILRGLTIAAAVAVVLLCTAKSAEATFQMRLTSSDGSVATINDNNLGLPAGTVADTNATAGAIVFNGTFGGFAVVVSTGISKPLTGSAGSPEMDLSYSATRIAGAPLTLTLEISDQDFTTSPIPLNLTYGGTSTIGTSTGAAGTGLNNALYDTANALTTLGPFPAGAFSGAGLLNVPLDNVAPANYSLTLRVVLVTSGVGGTASGDLQLSSVPEPASLAVWSVLGLAGLGYGGWRRKRAAK